MSGFVYHELPPIREIPRAKLVAKFPMQKKVIDANNNVWNYFINNGKVVYRFHAHAFREK